MSVSQGSKILASDCVSTNTASTLVLRDSSGNFSAHNITVNSVLAQVENPSYSSALILRGRYSTSSTGYATCGGIHVECTAANTEGWAYLTLGNTTKSNANDNTSGRITLYNSNGGSSKIEGKYSSILGGNKNYLKMEYAALYGGLCIMDSDSVEIGSLYSTSKGTTSAEGWCTLTLGNSKTSTTANNASGKIQLYNNNGGSVTIQSVYGNRVGVNDNYLLLDGGIAAKRFFHLRNANNWYIGQFYEIASSTNTLGACVLQLGNPWDASTGYGYNGRIKLYKRGFNLVTIKTDNSYYAGTYDYLMIEDDQKFALNQSSYIERNLLSITTKLENEYSSASIDVEVLKLSCKTRNTANVQGFVTLTLGKREYLSNAPNLTGRIILYGTNYNECIIEGTDTGPRLYGRVSFSNQYYTSGGYTDAAVQIREYNFNTYSGTGGNGQAPNGWGSAPRLAWHWAGLTAATIGLATNGYLYEAPATGTTYSQISLVSSSSRTIKHNIQNLPNFGEIIDKLNPVSFIYNSRANEGIRYGLIYEDTKDILPDVCKADPFTEGGAFINYTDIVPVLIKEIQSLRRRTRDLETQLSFLTQPNILPS